MSYKTSALQMHGKLFQEEYKRFKKQFKSMCANNDWTLVDFHCGWECISCFIRDNKTGNYVYCLKQDWNTSGLLSDKAWVTDRWLVRECKHRKDYTGGVNNYFPYSSISEGIKSVLCCQKVKTYKKVLAYRSKKHR